MQAGNSPFDARDQTHVAELSAFGEAAARVPFEGQS